MNIDSGEIFKMDEDEALALREATEREFANAARLADMKARKVALSKDEAEELAPMQRSQRKGYMRNQPCPCGSGKKFKNCHW